MQQKYRIFGVLAVGLLLIIGNFLWMAQTKSVSAQCGSQASSCKNCHEVQGEDPVNNDGTSWHEAHAFGDFCYICHAGNSQATNKDEAHQGMVDPMEDVKASCQQCHVDDLMDRAQVYADTLGIEIGTSSASAAGGETADSAETASSGVGLRAPTELEVDDPNLVDYSQRYEEVAYGTPMNIGNAILAGLIGLIVLGGGAFVIYNEGWLGVDYESIDEYPAEVVEILPKVTKLSPPTRKKLEKALDNPEKVEKILSELDDTEEGEA